MNWTPQHIAAASTMGLIPKIKPHDLLQATKDYNFLNPIDIYQKVDTQIQTWVKDKHYQILTPVCREYPLQLLEIKSPPLLLFVLGNPCWINRQNLAVVGRREAQTYTLQWMESEFSKFLSQNLNLNIISGGARGIDQKAHVTAITYKLPTTVVLPSGLDHIYPANLHRFKESILENGGCFISAYLPSTPMYKKHFHDRNEIIAALSSHIFIVEAQIRSGTYKTALYGIELNRSMGILPSFPLDSNYSGSMQLLYDGAQLIRDFKDLSLFASR